MNAPPTVKTCGCGLSYNRAEWDALAYVGTQKTFGAPDLELRNCACMSTLAIELPGRDCTVCHAPLGSWAFLGMHADCSELVQTRSTINALADYCHEQGLRRIGAHIRDLSHDELAEYLPTLKFVAVAVRGMGPSRDRESWDRAGALLVHIARAIEALK